MKAIDIVGLLIVGIAGCTRAHQQHSTIVDEFAHNGESKTDVENVRAISTS